jgi:hypothetical protein
VCGDVVHPGLPLHQQQPLSTTTTIIQTLGNTETQRGKRSRVSEGLHDYSARLTK